MEERTICKIEDPTGDVEMSTSEMTFDNLTIMKEFSNIANLVRNEDFLETVPKAKLKRVKWVPMFNCLKQGILDEMVQELSDMWKYEDMPQKIESLESQKEKFADESSDSKLWRPQLNNVQSQLRAHDVANLQKQKVQLESLAAEYELRVNKRKKSILAKRGYMKALQGDMEQYQKKNKAFISQINDKFDNHDKMANRIIPTILEFDDIQWDEKDLESSE